MDDASRFRGDKIIGERATRVGAIMQSAMCVVSNDSGMAHVAGALGCRVLVICGMNPGKSWYGYYPRARWINGTLGCSPCCETYATMRMVGCMRTEACYSLYGIRPQEVLSETMDMLGNPESCLHSVLRALVQEERPASYLEIGVREGDSLKVVLDASGESLHRIALADTWGDSYGGTGRRSNAHIKKLLNGYGGEVLWLDGDSKQTIPPLVDKFDLITVDGDHSPAGARADLEAAREHLLPHGRLVFDDIAHPGHPWLRDVADEFASAHMDIEIERVVTERPHGVIVFRRGG
jgi:hypothetical protein